MSSKSFPSQGWVDVKVNLSKIKKYFYSIEGHLLTLFKDEDRKKDLYTINLESSKLCYLSAEKDSLDATKKEITFDIFEKEYFQFECNNKSTLAEWIKMITPYSEVIGITHYPLHTAVYKSNHCITMVLYRCFKFIHDNDYKVSEPLIQPGCYDLNILNDFNDVTDLKTIEQAHLIIHYFINALNPPLIPNYIHDGIIEAFKKESVVSQVEMLKKSFVELRSPYKSVCILLFHYLHEIYEKNYGMLDELVSLYENIFEPPKEFLAMKSQLVTMCIENFGYIFTTTDSEREILTRNQQISSFAVMKTMKRSEFTELVHSKIRPFHLKKKAKESTPQLSVPTQSIPQQTEEDIKSMFKKKQKKESSVVDGKILDEQLQQYCLIETESTLEKRMEKLRKEINDLKQLVLDQDQMILTLKAEYDKQQASK